MLQRSGKLRSEPHSGIDFPIRDAAATCLPVVTVNGRRFFFTKVETRAWTDGHYVLALALQLGGLFNGRILALYQYAAPAGGASPRCGSKLGNEIAGFRRSHTRARLRRAGVAFPQPPQVREPVTANCV